MEALLSQLPFAGVIISIVVIILGVAAGIYMLDGFRSKKKKEQDDADDRLNGILEKTVKELVGKVTQLEKREQELTKEVSNLTKDNEKYLSILQGRDQQTQEFYRQCLDSIKVTRDTHELVTTLTKSFSETNANMKSLIELISKHITVLDHSIINK